MCAMLQALRRTRRCGPRLPPSGLPGARTTLSRVKGREEEEKTVGGQHCDRPAREEERLDRSSPERFGVRPPTRSEQINHERQADDRAGGRLDQIPDQPWRRPNSTGRESASVPTPIQSIRKAKT